MPALLSPQPLLPPFEVISSPRPFVSPSPIYCPKNHSSISYNRFRSPALSPEPCTRLIPAMSKPLYNTSASTTRRRTKASSHALRRRRLASRADYRPEPSPLHTFDKLPWIASLDLPPDNVHPYDTADLSLIPTSTLPQIRPSGPGPIRRRKTSPRSSPLLPSPLEDHAEDDDDHLFHYTPNLFPRNIPERPSTPTCASRLDPAHITFRNLMPVTDDDV